MSEFAILTRKQTGAERRVSVRLSEKDWEEISERSEGAALHVLPAVALSALDELERSGSCLLVSGHGLQKIPDRQGSSLRVLVEDDAHPFPTTRKNVFLTREEVDRLMMQSTTNLSQTMLVLFRFYFNEGGWKKVSVFREKNTNCV